MSESPCIDRVTAGKYEIPVLYMDNHVLAAVKPCNMPVQADASGDVDMLTALKRYVGVKFDKPGNVYLGLVHRLDRPVGGVMVFARTSKAASRLSAEFSAHTADKRYLAVLQGCMAGEMALNDWLYKDEKSGMVRVAAPGTPGAKQASLKTRPVASRGGTTLTDVALFTGRSHQIRVQHMNAGYPLWGDARYGGGRPGQQIALWAYRLAFVHPTLKEEMRFCALPRGGVWDMYKAELENLS